MGELDLRIVRLIPTNEEINFEDLKQGQRFRLYESDGEFVGAYVATRNAFLNSNGIYEIDTIKIREVVE